MKWTWMRNYCRMREELHANDVGGCECKGKYEKGFSIVASYWNELLPRLGVENMDVCSQIIFYKTIQPHYFSHQEYFSLVVNSFLFCPSAEFSNEYRKYWIRQCHRLDRYINENREICNYYLSGETMLDDFYFTRANNESSTLHHLSPSRIIAKYLGLVKYNEFANNKWLEAIGKNRTTPGSRS